MYLSTSYRHAEQIGSILREIGESSSVRHVELSGGTSFSQDLFSTVEALGQEYGFHYLLHNYFPPVADPFVLNIADADSKARERSLRFAKQSIRWTSKLGIPHYTIHAGYPESLTLTEDGSRFRSTDGRTHTRNNESIKGIFRESVSELLRYSEKYNVKFGVENLFPSDSLGADPLLCSPEEIKKILRENASNQNFGILLDVGHLNVSGTELGFDPEAAFRSIVDAFSDDILEIHFSYNDGVVDSHDLVPLDSWMADVMDDYRIESIPAAYEPRGYSLEQVMENMEQHGLLS